MENNTIWIFNGAGGRFPGGVFNNLTLAENWININKLSGILTEYPLNEGCFDWAVKNDLTNLSLKKLEEKKKLSSFIGSFTTASQQHFHYEEGIRV